MIVFFLLSLTLSYGEGSFGTKDDVFLIEQVNQAALNMGKADFMPEAWLKVDSSRYAAEGGEALRKFISKREGSSAGYWFCYQAGYFRVILFAGESGVYLAAWPMAKGTSA